MVRPEVGGGVAGGGQSERRRQSKEQREAWHVGLRRYLPIGEGLNYQCEYRFLSFLGFH